MPSIAALSADSLERAVRAAGIDAPVRFEEVTGSTNRDAMQWAEAGAPAWSVVAADHQTAGRGRLGRTWVSAPGRAVLFSVVLRPDVDADRAGLLTLAAGAAMAEVTGARCKWPNDLLVDGGKAGGILAEAKVEGTVVAFVVAGVGVNVGEPPDDVEGAAAFGAVEPAELVTTFLRRLRELIEPGDGLMERVLAAYRPLCATLGRRVHGTTLAGAVVEGLAVDVDERGSLVIQTDGGLETIGFGEIAHLDR